MKYLKYLVLIAVLCVTVGCACDAGTYKGEAKLPSVQVQNPVAK